MRAAQMASTVNASHKVLLLHKFFIFAACHRAANPSTRSFLGAGGSKQALKYGI